MKIEIVSPAQGGYKTRLPEQISRFWPQAMPRRRFCDLSAIQGEVLMLTKPLLSHILNNDALTRGLGDEEARILVEWLVDQAEYSAQGDPSESAIGIEVTRLCRRGRAIGRFVELWCHSRARGAAGQLAVAEGFTWPLPQPEADPCEIMQTILTWEAKHARC